MGYGASRHDPRSRRRLWEGRAGALGWHGDHGSADRTALALVIAVGRARHRLRNSARSAGRRECLDHVIVLNERHLRRILASYLDYYHRSRCHLSLDKDAPYGRPVQPVGSGEIVAFPQVGGLYHRYEWLAA